MIARLVRQPSPLLYDAPAVLAAVAFLALFTTACDKAVLLAPTNSSISINASTRVLPINGTAQIVATVLENSGSPVPNGTTVRFTTTLGRVEPAEVLTRNGVAETTFHAGTTSGVAEVRAFSGLARPTTGPSTGTGTGTGTPTTSGSSDVVQITIGAAAAARISLAANPATVRPGGPSVITAFVADANGNAVPDVPVSFSTNRGSVNPTAVNTDATGEARTTFTGTLNGADVAVVTARVGVGDQNRTATTEIRALATPSFTLTTAPAGPVVGQPVSLTITPAANTSSSVTVNWGDGNQQSIGTVAAARSVTHTYETAGFYTITATGTSDGDSFTNAISVTINQPPPVEVRVTPQFGNLATIFTFTITPTPGALVTSVTINYGDGQQDSLGAIRAPTTKTHQYATTGVKTITVTQTEANGNVTVATTTVTVSP